MNKTDNMKIRQAADVLNITIDKYFSFAPDKIGADQMEYLKVSLPTIQSLLETSANLLYEGIDAITD